MAGATIVAATNFMVQRWRYLTDRLGAAADQLCSEINSAADTATEYWLLDAKQGEEQARARGLEPLLVGRQIRLQQLLLSLQEQDRRLKLDVVDARIADLYTAMTGGQFKVAGRDPDDVMAQQVQAVAAGLVGELRKALRHRNKRWF
jgi:hypothetical protein